MTKLTQSELEELLKKPSKLVLPTLDRRRTIYKNLGWLYILRNPGLGRKHLKVGMTARFPERRALELSQSTAIPTSFQLIYYVHVGDRYKGERYAHDQLEEHRLSSNKEFFITTITKAVRALDDAAEKFPVYMTTPKGRVNGIIPQDIQPRVVTCNNCGKKARIRELLIPTILKCGHCGKDLDLENI